VLKKSFFAMTENSQDRWRISFAAMRGTISNTAKSTAEARIDSTDLSAAGIANMHHLRDFSKSRDFEFFNTIGAKRASHIAYIRSSQLCTDCPEIGAPFRTKLRTHM
jgi:hypothetical protein